MTLRGARLRDPLTFGEIIRDRSRVRLVSLVVAPGALRSWAHGTGHEDAAAEHIWGARARRREVPAPAPAYAIPVWVRGRDHRDAPGRPPRTPGLGEGDAPLHATLWGEPRCGCALAGLADGTVVRGRRGRWSASGWATFRSAALSARVYPDARLAAR